MKSISTLFRQLSLIVVLISAFSLSAWGGEEIISNTFSSTTMQKSVSSYTDTWNNISGTELNLVNFNNNQKEWTYVKCGRKNNTSIGTITTTSPLTEKITKVEVTIDAVTASKINSTYLQVASDASFTQNVQKVIVTIAKGTITYEIPTPTSNCYYRLTYDCASGSSNGLVTISKVNFYYNTGESGGGDPETPCTNPTISFTETTVTKTNREAPFTNTLTTNSSGAVTYTSSATNVATVDNDGQVTINGVGTTTITATVAADGTYCEATAEYTLTVEGRTFDITWMNGTDTHAETTYTEGGTLTLPTTDPTSCSDNYSTFVGWYTQQAGPTSTPSTELQGTEASKTDITGPTIFYAVFGEAGEGGATIASLTEDKIKTNITNTKCEYDTQKTYTDTENNITWASYGYTDQPNRPWIQYKKGSNYYLQATTQQPVKKITLTITSPQNSSGGIADITKHDAYSTEGTITISDGSKTITTASGVTINNNILEIDLSNNTNNTIRILTSTGCRIWNVELSFSSSSSAYISTCDGEEVITPDAPTFNPAGGDFTETQSVEISAEDGASIYYTLNGDEPTITSTLYNNTAIEISETKTIKAIAVLNGVESSVSEAEYRINIVDDIAAFIEKQPTVETKISGTVTVVAQDKSKQRIWVQDNSGAIMIYSSPALDMEYTAGQQFTNLKGKYAEYNGSTQLQTTELPVATEGQVPTPTEATLKNIVDNMNNYIHKYVKINDISYDGTAISDGTNSLSLYDHFGTDLSNVNKEYKANVEGIVGYYNTNQFYILKYEEIIPIIPTISTNVTTIDFNDVKQGATSDKNFTIEFYNLTSEINIECNNSSFNLTTEEVSESEWSVEITFNAPTQVGIQEGTITISSEGAEPKTVTLTANVYEAYTINFGSTEKETNAEGKVTEIPTLDGVVGWTTNSEFAIVDEKPDVIDENTIFEENTQLYPIYSITEEGQEEVWTLVTDASTLAVGDQVVIAAAEYNYALSTNQKTNNRGQVSINKNGNNTITLNNEVQILTLEEGTTSGTFAFNTGSGYLYAASSSSNHLKTNDDKDANGSWKITITDGVTSIVAQGNNTRNTMQYNQQSSLFACYDGSASQKGIALYKKTGGAITKYNIAGNKTVDNNITFDVENNINVNTLTIKSNLDEAGQVAVTSGSLTAQKVVVEKTIDASRWFFFSLPFDCQIKDIVAIAENGNPLTYDEHYVISKYNPTRAEGQNNAWEELLDTELKLNANQGYIIGHWYQQSDNIIVKFPSTDAQTITAPADKTLNYTNTWFVNEENKNSSKGFNLIGMPYYQKINSTISCGNVYIYSTTPNPDGETYTQEAYTGNNVAPFTSFFVQVAENTAPTFTITETQSAAPMLRAKDVVAKATITLADANGGADETTVINNPTKTTDYEIGHDLVKWIGYAEIPQIYSLQGDEMLAFNSLAIDNSTVIPLGVYAHADGDYTFSLSEKSVGDLEGWELYDNETGKTTRLANEDLTVNLAQGTHEGRFEIRLQQRISTDCDNAMGDMTTWTANGTLNINNLPADAVVYIYDAVGRMVYVANNNSTTFNYTFAARGVYNIVVRTAENSVSFKTIY